MISHISYVLAEQLEKVLTEVAPDEADLASALVWGAGRFSKMNSLLHAFAPSGGGIVPLLGPHVLAVLIAIICGHILKTDSAQADVLLKELKNFAKRAAYDANDREYSPFLSRDAELIETTTMLAEKGWDITSAERVAGCILKAGEEAANHFITDLRTNI